MPKFYLLSRLYLRIQAFNSSGFYYEYKDYSKERMRLIEALPDHIYERVEKEINDLDVIVDNAMDANLEKILIRNCVNIDNPEILIPPIRYKKINSDYYHVYYVDDEEILVEIDPDFMREHLKESENAQAEYVRDLNNRAKKVAHHLKIEFHQMKKILTELSVKNSEVNVPPKVVGFKARRTAWIEKSYHFLLNESILSEETSFENYRSLFTDKPIANGIIIKKDNFNQFIYFFRTITHKKKYLFYDGSLKKKWLRLTKIINSEVEIKSLKSADSLRKTSKPTLKNQIKIEQWIYQNIY